MTSSNNSKWVDQGGGWYTLTRYPLRSMVYYSGAGEVSWCLFFIGTSGYSETLGEGLSPSFEEAKSASEVAMRRAYRYMEKNAYFGNDFWGTDLGIDILANEVGKVD